jgi:hypothetical protein
MDAPDNGAAQDVDLDLDALEADATHRPFTFRLAGQRFEIPHPNDFDWHVQEDIASGDLARMFKALLGDQFEAFDAVAVPTAKMARLMEDYSKHFGVDVGESPASPDSSATTGAPSRPILPTTTTVVSTGSPPAT